MGNRTRSWCAATYPAPEDADEHAAIGAWRAAVMVSLAPRAALARLRELLEEKGFVILAQIKGPKINERLPKEYAILQVTVPVAAVKYCRVDPLAPVAIMFPIAVIPTEDGRSGSSPPPTLWRRCGSTASWSSGTCRPRSRSGSPRCRGTLSPAEH